MKQKQIGRGGVKISIISTFTYEGFFKCFICGYKRKPSVMMFASVSFNTPKK